MKIPYKVVVENNPLRGPKGKMPFAVVGSDRVADSSFIVQRLLNDTSIDADRSQIQEVSPQEFALKVAIEEYFYFILLYYRWLDPTGWSVTRDFFKNFFPLPLRGIVLEILRGRLRKQAYQQGLARHSGEEIDLLAVRMLESMEDWVLRVGQNLPPDKIHELDWTIAPFITTVIKQPIRNQLYIRVQQYPHLVEYALKRFKAAGF
ncbi:MAG: hypothetical protein K2X47_03270 [Bdellovibrionales bacterium]|nr:hypothetical protein [Bdellovibrionales bacterium]